VVGGFVAATVVTLVQFLRLRDKRLLLLAAMFAFQAQALAREWWDVWRDVFQAGVCAAGLGLLLALASPARATARDAPQSAGVLPPEKKAPGASD
jgi:hypothetical protein